VTPSLIVISSLCQSGPQLAWLVEVLFEGKGGKGENGGGPGRILHEVEHRGAVVVLEGGTVVVHEGEVHIRPHVEVVVEPRQLAAARGGERGGARTVQDASIWVHASTCACHEVEGHISFRFFSQLFLNTIFIS